MPAVAGGVMLLQQPSLACTEEFLGRREGGGGVDGLRGVPVRGGGWSCDDAVMPYPSSCPQAVRPRFGP